MKISFCSFLHRKDFGFERGFGYERGIYFLCLLNAGISFHEIQTEGVLVTGTEFEFQNHLVRRPSILSSLAKWLSVPLRTKLLRTRSSCSR